MNITPEQAAALKAPPALVFDIEIPPGWNVGIYRRKDGDWTLNYYHKKYAQKAVLKKGAGHTFEAALADLKQNIQGRAP